MSSKATTPWSSRPASARFAASTASWPPRRSSPGPRPPLLRPTAKAKPGRPASSSRRTPSAARAPPGALGVGKQDEDLGPAGRRLLARHRDRAGRRRAGRPLADEQEAGAPLLHRGRERVRAADEDGGAAVELHAQLARARQHVGRLGERALEHRAHEAVGGRGRRPVGRAHAIHLGGDQGGDEAQEGRIGRVVAPAQAHPAHDAVRHAQLEDLDVGTLGEQRALVGRRGGGGGENGAGPVDDHDAALEGAGGGAHDLGQPGARLDGVGDLLQRAEVGSAHGRQGVARRAHGAKSRSGVRARAQRPRPASGGRAPTSMRAETGDRAAAVTTGRHPAGRLGGLEVVVPEPHHRGAHQPAERQAGGEHVEREEERGGALPHGDCRRSTRARR